MSDIFLVTDHILFSFIPSIVIPFTLGLILIGFFIRFTRNMDSF